MVDVARVSIGQEVVGSDSLQHQCMRGVHAYQVHRAGI